MRRPSSTARTGLLLGVAVAVFAYLGFPLFGGGDVVTMPDMPLPSSTTTAR